MERVIRTETEPTVTRLITGSETFRPDVEGLRAVAVGLVLLFHAGVPAFDGGYVGVDVFFVLSGFLITGLLVREIERTGTIRLGSFYARRIRRLLPATALTLAGVAVLTVAALPVIRWLSTGRDIQWAAMYGVNWRLASQAVDYLAAEEASSPVQHFWSLSVEEQFYFVWPFILLVIARWAHHRGSSLRKAMITGLSLVAVPSLLWSVALTSSEPGRAYFVTTTRVWELALGGGLAIVAPHLADIRRPVAATMAATGIVGIVTSAVMFGPATPFPGTAALVPVVSTMLVIAAGIARIDTPTAKMLGTSPMRKIGELSYSLYLWHWPFVVAADAIFDGLTVAQGLGAIAVSVVPAVLAYHAVEKRWRHSPIFVQPVRRGIAIGIALTAVGLISGTALVVSVPDVEGGASEPGRPGIESFDVVSGLSDPLQIVAGDLVPNPLVARDDLPVVYEAGCHRNQQDSDAASCEFGAPDGPTVLLIGDSHAAQWVPTFTALADEHGWQLRTYTKSACQYADVTSAIGDQLLPYESCIAWNENVRAAIDSESPDAVIFGGAFWPKLIDSGEVVDDPGATAVLLEAALIRSWTPIRDAGIPVIALRDVPYPRFDVPECVVEHLADLSECAFDRDGSTEFNTPHVGAAEAVGATLIDATDWICLEAICPAVVDDVLVWRDNHHLTAMYALSLAPTIEAALAASSEVGFLVDD